MVAAFKAGLAKRATLMIVVSLGIATGCSSERTNDDTDTASSATPPESSHADSSMHSLHLASSVTMGGLTISDFVAPAPAGDAPMALYFSVVSDRETPDTLLQVIVNDTVAEIHETRDGGMISAQFQTVSRSSPIVLSPGGLHAMIDAPVPRVVVGDSLRVVLVFSSAGRVEIVVPVVSYADLESISSHHSH